MGLSRRPFARTTILLWPVLLATPLVHAVHVDYAIETGIEHNDNVNLSEDDPVSEDILRPSLGFTVNEDGSTIQSAVTGLMEYRDYLHNRFSNEFRGQLDGRLNWSAIPERLDFTVQDRLGLQPVNVLAPNAPSNLQQVNVLAFGPTLRFRVGPTLRGQAELRYVNSYAEETDEFNSQRLSGALRVAKDLDADTALSANLEDERIEFTHDGISPDYSRYSAFGRYARTVGEIDLAADLGYSWLRYSGHANSALDRQDPFVRGKIGWKLSPQSMLSVEVARQISDAASTMLLDTGIGQQIPVDIAAGDATVTPAAYLEQRLQFAYAYQGPRAGFTFAPYYRKLDYSEGFDSVAIGGGDQKSRGGVGTASWRLTTISTIGLQGIYDDLTFEQVAREDKTWSIQAFLRHQWTPHWSLRGEVAHYRRSSNAAGQNSDQNSIYVALTYTR